MILRKSSVPYTGTRIPQLIKRPYYTAFNPNSITGLQVWLDGADPLATGTKPANGSTVTTWYDKSGLGQNATSTGSPTYNTTGLNSLPTVVFSGSQYFLGSVTNSGATLSAFVVTTVTTALPRTGDLFIMTLGASGISGFTNSAYYGVAKIPTTTTTIGSFRNGALSSYSGITANSPFIASSIVSGSNSILYVTGAPGSTVSTSGNFTISQYALGSDTLTSAGIFIGGISEVLLYSTALSVTEQQTIESYLAQKWALTASLPANHRNFSRPAGMPATTRAPLSILSLISSGFMSTVYNLSTYSLVNIANAVSSGNSSNAYIWTVAVPANAKGKNGILAIFFNLNSATAFTTSQYFDYGIYVDGVAQMLGDATGTLHYIQTASGNYAMSSGGISLGINGLLNGFPLILPVSFSAGASVIQIGLKNSLSYMSPVNSSVPGYLSNNLTTTLGAGSNTSTYIPQTAFTTGGYSTYTVPSLCSAGSVTGVYIYLWGSSGFGQTSAQNNAGGPGGFVSGFYQCAAGTVLSLVVGTCLSSASISQGGEGTGSQGSGGFSGVFLGSTTADVTQANAIGIAGGGAGSGYLGASGGYGGYPAGGNSIPGNTSETIYGGTQIAGGTGSGGNGSALRGGNGCGGWGSEAGAGGWYGGGGGACTGSGALAGGGGSSYIGNINGATGGIGFTSSATYANGASQTSPGADSPAPANLNNYYIAGYGRGRANTDASRYGTGLVIIVPATGTASTQIGVSATLFSG